MVYPQENRISAPPGQWACGRERGIGGYILVLSLPQPCLGLSKSCPHRQSGGGEELLHQGEWWYILRLGGQGGWGKVNWETLSMVL